MSTETSTSPYFKYVQLGIFGVGEKGLMTVDVRAPRWADGQIVEGEFVDLSQGDPIEVVGSHVIKREPYKIVITPDNDHALLRGAIMVEV
ncbi:MAG TPA: hypothetical protein PK863_02985 [Candidatus Dojkabacteria bacterium]|nr:hypothetical protein [Candidatus Dojkabacteria bacterium]HRP51406.1 hypothetical protein [Candidatus Dojkabacteria bacterium]